MTHAYHKEGICHHIRLDLPLIEETKAEWLGLWVESSGAAQDTAHHLNE
jgi:hypothetical protein